MHKTIAILEGDGIGHEVMISAIKILNAISHKFDHSFNYVYGLVGGSAYTKYQQHLPEETINICRNSDAILFGSVGGPITEQNDPKWKDCETNSILALRSAFNFNINLRKANIYKELLDLSPLKPQLLEGGLDIVIFRELLGDIYFGEHSLGEKNGLRYAKDVATYDEEQIRSIAVYAFGIARSRNKNLVSVDKANVLATSKLWRQVVSEVAKDFPDVKYQNMLVDNCAMQLINNPKMFDVILTANLFGDILSDELSVLSGSIGMMPSASFNKHGFGLYEPAGGSAPEIAGLDIANPIAQILSASMMLSYSFKLSEEASMIEKAIKHGILQGFRTRDLVNKADDHNIKIVGTQEFTAQIVKYIL
jgi:3-isopropylmalate dehydrogenase